MFVRFNSIVNSVEFTIFFDNFVCEYFIINSSYSIINIIVLILMRFVHIFAYEAQEFNVKCLVIHLIIVAKIRIRVNVFYRTYLKLKFI